MLMLFIVCLSYMLTLFWWWGDADVVYEVTYVVIVCLSYMLTLFWWLGDADVVYEVTNVVIVCLSYMLTLFWWLGDADVVYEVTNVVIVCLIRKVRWWRAWLTPCWSTAMSTWVTPGASSSRRSRTGVTGETPQACSYDHLYQEINAAKM